MKLVAAAVFAAILAQLAAAQSAPASRPALDLAGYRNAAELGRATRELAAAHPDAATVAPLPGAGQPEVLVLQLAAPGDHKPEERPALLIVGGIDADAPAGAETALRTAAALLTQRRDQPDGPAAKLLQQRTLYIIPALDPAAPDRIFEPVRHERRSNARPIDDDRDERIDEDGPNDLDGDGCVGVMRIPDPQGDWLPDPDEPRLLRKADAAKGERGLYRLLLEGRDDDNDGEIDEDPPGGVDLDRNWPHLYEAGHPEVGVHQLSEAAARALAEFVIAHPRLVAAVVYGRHDNIIRLNKETKRGPDGRSFRDLHSDDVKLYEFLSDKYKQATGLKSSGSGARPEGALYAWLYAQRGLVTLATTAWWPLDADAAASQPASRPATQSGAGDEPPPPETGNRPPPDEPRPPAPPAERVRPRGAPPGGAPPGGPGRLRGGRGGGGPPGRAAPPAPEPGAAAGTGGLAARVESNETTRKWLKYSDEQRGGAGFIPWQKFDHPTLGPVEIGGFAPYFMSAPPAADLDDVAVRQAKFIADFGAMLASPQLVATRVRDAGAGVWEIELRVRNTAALPTHTAMARQLELGSFAVRPKLEKSRVIGGRLLERVDSVAAGSASSPVRWLIAGAAGDGVEFVAFNRFTGEFALRVPLVETKPGQEVLP
jgi:hypothetical protein